MTVPHLTATLIATTPATFPSYGHYTKPLYSRLRSGVRGEEGGGGLRHTGNEEMGWLDVTVLESRRLRISGWHKKNLPFVGSVLGHVQLYREREGGGGGSPKTDEPKDKYFRGQDHWGEPFSTPSPLLIPRTTISTVGEWDLRQRVSQNDRVGGGHPGIGWSLSEAGGKWRFTAANRSGSPGTEWSWRGGEGRGNHERVDMGGGGGSGSLG